VGPTAESEAPAQPLQFLGSAELPQGVTSEAGVTSARAHLPRRAKHAPPPLSPSSSSLRSRLSLPRVHGGSHTQGRRGPSRTECGRGPRREAQGERGVPWGTPRGAPPAPNPSPGGTVTGERSSSASPRAPPWAWCSEQRQQKLRGSTHPAYGHWLRAVDSPRRIGAGAGVWEEVGWV